MKAVHHAAPQNINCLKRWPNPRTETGTENAIRTPQTVESQRMHPKHALWLAGFSFGAWVSLRGAVELGAKALISIAPPVGRSWDFENIALPQLPWLVIQGQADEVVDAHAVRAWVSGLPQPPILIEMPDTSHFFHRKLIDLRGVIRHIVHSWLPA